MKIIGAFLVVTGGLGLLGGFHVGSIFVLSVGVAIIYYDIKPTK
jgi:hypothetical protein